ncbi:MULTISPECIES: hypothetical protein [unclassified Paraburkholderia]|uniref:hypothetical protein n=1 Tax=unclassified Paraburkholderia TaxID=2615204 RepID=UPI002AAF6DBF|nr:MULTISPECIES: hypothetical protein [unclassified Paraburkholderia]
MDLPTILGLLVIAALVAMAIWWVFRPRDNREVKQPEAHASSASKANRHSTGKPPFTAEVVENAGGTSTAAPSPKLNPKPSPVTPEATRKASRSAPLVVPASVAVNEADAAETEVADETDEMAEAVRLAIAASDAAELDAKQADYDAQATEKYAAQLEAEVPTDPSKQALAKEARNAAIAARKGADNCQTAANKAKEHAQKAQLATTVKDAKDAQSAAGASAVEAQTARERTTRVRLR